jgi:tetratricopeptide (TPR) repeat protein
LVPFNPTSGAVDVILAIGALATIVAVVRAWRSVWDDDFTVSDRRLVTQAAVFVVVPAVVLLHELGHLFAAQALGVRVIGFRYGLFEGAVTIAGPRTPAQEWLIALAGNAVSAGVGLAMVVVALAASGLRRPLRYLLLMGGLLELVFSLVAYPALSLTSRFGDWIIVYDPRVTPGLSWATAVVHASALIVLWRWWRRRGRAAVFAIGTGAEEAVSQLQAAVQSSPHDPGPWLALADFYARRGELPLARSTIEQAIAACGELPRLFLGLTRLSMFQARWNDAVIAARRGLQTDPAGLEDDVRQPLWANLALALTQMERPTHALPAYGHLTEPLVDDVRVRYGRGIVRMESGDQAGGRADLEAVVRQLPDGHLLRRWAEARMEGHPLRDWEDTRVPASQRRTAPPPAPIAGV